MAFPSNNSGGEEIGLAAIGCAASAGGFCGGGGGGGTGAGAPAVDVLIEGVVVPVCTVGHVDTGTIVVVFVGPAVLVRAGDRGGTGTVGVV